MKERCKKLSEKVDEQTKLQMIHKREKEELAIIRSSLEARLSEALVKAEAVP
jgi:hypothetical protein